MIKRQLVMRIAAETGMIQQDVLAVVQRFLDHVTESLEKGETVELRDFGVFEVVERKARLGRNPHKPEQAIPIPPRRVVKFKPGRKMRKLVLAGKPQPATE